MAQARLPTFPNYTLGDELGRGTFGIVYACERHAEHPRAQGLDGGLAVKVFDLSRIPPARQEIREQNMRREVVNLRKLPPHQNIVRFVEFLFTGDWAGLVMERVRGRDLWMTIDEQNIKPYENDLPVQLVFWPFEEAQTRFVFRQIITGLGFLHSYGIMHRDIKFENIFVEENNGDAPDLLHVKIGDLGVSKDVGLGMGEAVSYSGTPGFIAPEVLACRDDGFKAYTFKADVWSVGVITFVLLAGRFFFQEDASIPTSRLKKAAQAKQTEICKEIFDLKGVSDNAHSILMGMLDKSDETRLSVEGVRNHQWFDSPGPELARSAGSPSSSSSTYRPPHRMADAGGGSEVRRCARAPRPRSRSWRRRARGGR